MATWILLICLTALLASGGVRAMETVKMPAPPDRKESGLGLLLHQRHSVRGFADRAISLGDLSYILWSSYGYRSDRGRVVPSAGALYPLEIYLVTGESGVETVPAGVFRYRPAGHDLQPVLSGDIRNRVAQAALSQMWMAKAPAMVVIAVEYGRITAKYRERGVRYAHMEAGNVSQNIALAVQVKGLGCGIVGAFVDEEVKGVLALPRAHEPLLVMPVGYPR